MKDKLIRDINRRKKDITWLKLRNLIFQPLLRLRSINPDFEEEWLTLIFDTPNRIITNYKVIEQFDIVGTFLRVPQGKDKPAPRNRTALLGSTVTIRRNKREENIIDIELDACPEDATLLTRWFRVTPTEYYKILKYLK